MVLHFLLGRFGDLMRLFLIYNLFVVFLVWFAFMLSTVLERFLVRSRWSAFVSFVLGLVFSLIGIFLALQTGVGFVALFIISIAVLPLVNRSISVSELLSGRVSSVGSSGIVMDDVAFRPTRWRFSQFLADFRPLFGIYLGYFVTVFVFFVVIGAFLDFRLVSSVFVGQFGSFVLGSPVSLSGLLFNNLGVLWLGFVFASLFEFGATFVVIRNAIFWGLTLGLFIAVHPGNILAVLLILPHLVLEASAYFVSSIAGGVLSRAVVEEKIESERFHSLFTQVAALFILSLALISVAVVVETFVFNTLLPAVF